MRLAALVHVQLELGMRSASSSSSAVQRRRALAAQEREHVARLGQQPLEQRTRDLVEAGARGDRARRPAAPGTRPRAPATPSAEASREATAISPVTTPASASRIAAAFSSAERSPRKATSAARPAGIDSVGTTCTGLPATRAACSAPSRRSSCSAAARPRRRGGRVDRFEQVGRRRVHRLAALDDPLRAEVLEQSPVALAGDHGDDAERDAPPGNAASSRSSRSSVWRCMSAISTPSIVPARVPSESAAPGSSVWTCTFSADGSPTTSSESPSRSSSGSSARVSSPSPSTTNVVQ